MRLNFGAEACCRQQTTAADAPSIHSPRLVHTCAELRASVATKTQGRAYRRGESLCQGSGTRNGRDRTCNERLYGITGFSRHAPGQARRGGRREVERYHHEQLREHRRRRLRAALRVLALHVLADCSVTEQTDAAPRGLPRVVLCCVHPCPESDAGGKRHEEDRRPRVALAEAAAAPGWRAGRRRLCLPFVGSWQVTTALVAGHANAMYSQASEDAQSPAPVVSTHEQS